MIDTDPHLFLPSLHSMLSAPCAYANKVMLDFSRPSQPTDQTYIESFNGSFREECLNVLRFEGLTDARAKMVFGNRRTIRSRLSQEPDTLAVQGGVASSSIWIMNVILIDSYSFHILF